MTQNIYDNAAFFAAYSTFRRSVEGLDGAPEWASLRAMLPDVRGLRVLDLGCGFGWFCGWALAEGAVGATAGLSAYLMCASLIPPRAACCPCSCRKS
jgi:hypothetical protein